jgi:hypothetical protein
VSFAYQDDRLLRIVENGAGSAGSTIRFGYEEGELTSLSFSPTDPKVADGNGYTKFKREENGKIRVERTGEPSFDLHVQEIELDADHFPVKITDAGVYSIGEGGVWTKEYDGKYGSLFSWDASTGQLLKQEIYELETSQQVAVYTYKYDSAPGALSRIDCPLWFYAYWNQNYYALRTYRALFFGHANNLAEVTVDDSLNDRHEVLKYVYGYSPDGFPVSVSVQTSGGETLRTVQIQY